MVLRKLAMALLSLGVVLPGLTHALALREVKTQSALGEPFSAEIELSDLGDLTEEDIKVSLAQAEDFERLGIEQVYILAELRFQVVVNQGGRSYVKITTYKRMTEPFLDFIVRVSWPNNTRLQQVTALLDPPVSKVTWAKKPIAPPVVVVQAPPVIQPVAPVMPPVEAVVVVDNERSYKVKTNDTLWSVARRVRPTTAISVSKMMKVLHKANPDAFIANNINLLKDGKVLRVPSLMDTQSVSDAKLTAQNTSAPLPTQNPPKPLAQQQIDATANAKPVEKVATTPRVQMKLVAPTTSTVKSTGALSHQNSDSASTHMVGTGSGTGGSAKVQKVAKHNRILSQELAALENKLKLNDKKIAMQNAKLAHLEAQLKARRLAAEQAKQHDKKTDLDKKAVATLACAIATQSFFSTDAKAADETATTVAPATAPVKDAGSNNMLLVGGVALVIVIIALIFFLKGKGKKEQPPARPAAPPAPKPQAAAAPKPAAVTPPAKPVEPAKPQDPLEEVRPYLEMERFPQAVGILTKALVQHPDRADIHLKLLEIFAKQKDRTSFDGQYTKLEATGDLDAIVAADKLKQQFPEEVKPTVPNKDGTLEFTAAPKTAAPVVEEAPAMSLDDLENDFKLSLSQPNLKALDIPLAADPIELQRPEIASAPVESAKISEMDALLDGGLEFKFDTKEEAPAVEEEKAVDFNFSFDEPAVVAEEEKSSIDAGTGLSLDSLDDFLSEHKEPEPVAEVEEPIPTTNLDFEQELAKFKEEKHEPEVEDNLTEGFELEEFKFEDTAAKENDLGFDVADADFSIDEQPVIEETMDFNLDVDAPSVDLSDMVANFDKEELVTDIELPDDVDFGDVDVSISSDDVVAELDKEFSFLATTNENSTRLELARAYMEMGDRLGARDLLEEVVAEGDSSQKTEAQGMLVRIA